MYYPQGQFELTVCGVANKECGETISDMWRKVKLGYGLIRWGVA